MKFATHSLINYIRQSEREKENEKKKIKREKREKRNIALNRVKLK